MNDGDILGGDGFQIQCEFVFVENWFLVCEYILYSNGYVWEVFNGDSMYQLFIWYYSFGLYIIVSFYGNLRFV